MEREHYQLARGIARERDTARPSGHADDEGHPSERALETAGQLEDTQRHVVVLPEHDVVLEEDRVIRAEMDFGDGHDFPFHLAGARAELKFGHVAEARRFAPAGLAYQVANVERRSASAAGERGFIVLALAPLALDPLQGLGGIGHQ